MGKMKNLNVIKHIKIYMNHETKEEYDVFFNRVELFIIAWFNKYYSNYITHNESDSKVMSYRCIAESPSGFIKLIINKMCSRGLRFTDIKFIIDNTVDGFYSDGKNTTVAMINAINKTARLLFNHLSFSGYNLRIPGETAWENKEYVVDLNDFEKNIIDMKECFNHYDYSAHEIIQLRKSGIIPYVHNVEIK